MTSSTQTTSHSIPILRILGLTALIGSLHAQEPQPQAPFDLEQHAERAETLAYEQDDLAADVQDIIDEQTDPKLIELLRETEIIIADATDLLEDSNTGGQTIATQTEVIEKIFDAAKQKQQSQGSGEGKQGNMSSMLEMMENMMNGGKDEGAGKGEGEGESEGQGEGAGSNGGGGSGGGNGSGQAQNPDSTPENDNRRVPKSAGNTGKSIPKEFQKAMDAYNKGVQQQR